MGASAGPAHELPSGRRDKRLRDCRDPVLRLRDQAHPLGRKLAAVVWQLPSKFTVDTSRLAEFLRALRC